MSEALGQNGPPAGLKESTGADPADRSTNNTTIDTTLTTAATNPQDSNNSSNNNNNNNGAVDLKTYPHCPVYILSKGRYEQNRGTINNFIKELIPFTLVVEEEEREEYGRMIDNFVYIHFGLAGMKPAGWEEEEEKEEGNKEKDKEVVAGTTTENSTTTGEETEGGSPKIVPKYSWCGCCRPPPDAENNTNPIVQRIRSAAQKISPLYHHGYEYEPMRHTHYNKSSSTEEGGGDPTPPRIPKENFMLHDVEEVRQLFKMEVLPESNKGVSYVRNYILHVLVPRDMSDCDLDRTGHLEELNLFNGIPDHSDLAKAVLSKDKIQSILIQHGLDVESLLNNTTTTNNNKKEKEENEIDYREPFIEGVRMAERREVLGKVLDSMAKKAIPHGLMGLYWVLDDDIYSFSQSLQIDSTTTAASPRRNSAVEYETGEGNIGEEEEDEENVASPTTKDVNRKNFQISSREMFREVERRIMKLRENAVKAEGGSHTKLLVPNSFTFTSREDMLQNNPNIDSDTPRKLNLTNFTGFPNIAVYSLEYNRFAYPYDEKAISINGYTNIACLFNYALLHNPPCPSYFPPTATRGIRPVQEVLVGYIGHDMLWYRFAVREDYDFNLQLIARGLSTVRFRNLGFEVPQMGKVRGGLTDYYRNCQDEIKKQNERFLQQWTSIAMSWVKGKNSTTREDIRVRWDLLHPSKCRYPGANLYLSGPLPQLQPQSRAVAGGEGGHPPAPAMEVKVPMSRQSVTQLLVDSAAAKRPRESENSGEQDASKAKKEDLPRVLTDEEALQVGLHPIPSAELHVGKIVCVVPPLQRQSPALVKATLIDGDVESGFSAVVLQQPHLSMLQGVKRCYEVPKDGIEAVATAIDQLLLEKAKSKEG